MKTATLKASKQEQDFFSDIKIISIVVHSVNKSWAKLIVLNDIEHKELMKASKKHYGKNTGNFALFMDANVYHELLHSGYGCLSKEDFDKLVKHKYNDAMGYDNKHNPLKKVE